MASNENIDYCINGNWVRAVFSALPAWFRFAQCFRRYKDQKDTVHLVNAGKYSSTLIVVIFSFLNVYFNLHFGYYEVGITLVSKTRGHSMTTWTHFCPFLTTTYLYMDIFNPERGQK